MPEIRLRHYAIAVLLLLPLFGGCSSRTVFLHPGDEPQQAAQLAANLIRAGYKVAPMKTALPEANQQAQIIYHPLLSGSDYLNGIVQIMASNGYSQPKLLDINQANQFFTQGNLGIFLPMHGQRLPPVMATHDCSRLRATLEPQATGELDLDIVQTDADLLLKGSYRLDWSGSGTLELKGQRFHVNLSSTQVETNFGTKDADLLELEQENVTEGPLPRHCSFIAIYGL
ncbi:hypothetical protein JYB88_16905 [Shewanella cyperi]|uniref:Lipoprotein n=1 Tax=Shewanella cyperi TaxID=2814292 RepID=A0A974XJZ7_9GAMM|nr:hypothetical protein [Shewanella cyperi]QSX29840.1 hypothetical protein JYB88_16905 [Shewanella cyperi]